MKDVSLNRSLDMTPYLSEGRVGEQSTLYDLFGVVYHYGAVFGGHYTATARLFNYRSEESSPMAFPGIHTTFPKFVCHTSI
jgi:hypothetical protein